MKYVSGETKPPIDVLSGLVGAIAFSIKASGGNDQDVAGAFRSMADCYDKRQAKVLTDMVSIMNITEETKEATADVSEEVLP